MKLAINLPMLVSWQAFGEAFAISRHLGIDPARLVDIFSDSGGGTNALKGRAAVVAQMLGGDEFCSRHLRPRVLPQGSLHHAGGGQDTRRRIAARGASICLLRRVEQGRLGRARQLKPGDLLDAPGQEIRGRLDVKCHAATGDNHRRCRLEKGRETYCVAAKRLTRSARRPGWQHISGAMVIESLQTRTCDRTSRRSQNLQYECCPRTPVRWRIPLQKRHSSAWVVALRARASQGTHAVIGLILAHTVGPLSTQVCHQAASEPFPKADVRRAASPAGLRPSRSLNRSSSLLESGRQVGCGYRPSWAISRHRVW